MQLYGYKVNVNLSCFRLMIAFVGAQINLQVLLNVSRRHSFPQVTISPCSASQVRARLGLSSSGGPAQPGAGLCTPELLLQHIPWLLSPNGVDTLSSSLVPTASRTTADTSLGSSCGVFSPKRSPKRGKLGGTKAPRGTSGGLCSSSPCPSLVSAQSSHG